MAHSGMVHGMDIIGERKDSSTYWEECEASGHMCSLILKETLTCSSEVLGQVFSNVCKVQTITHEGY